MRRTLRIVLMALLIAGINTGCGKMEKDNVTSQTQTLKENNKTKPEQQVQTHAKKTKKYDLTSLKNRLINNGYIETLNGAYWAAEQGPDIVPYLSKLLDNKGKYNSGAYPLNVIWALAQIGGEEAEKVLIEHNENLETALALEALNARKKNYKLSVLISDHEVHRLPSYESEVVGLVRAGDQVIVLKSNIVIDTEEGPRGGPAVFDYIDIPSQNLKGYIQRAGDDFPPVF